jgi:hypothetical protein
VHEPEDPLGPLRELTIGDPDDDPSRCHQPLVAQPVVLEGMNGVVRAATVGLATSLGWRQTKPGRSNTPPPPASIQASRSGSPPSGD